MGKFFKFELMRFRSMFSDILAFFLEALIGFPVGPEDGLLLVVTALNSEIESVPKILRLLGLVVLKSGVWSAVVSTRSNGDTFSSCASLRFNVPKSLKTFHEMVVIGLFCNFPPRHILGLNVSGFRR